MYGILCLLLVSVMIFLSGPMPDTLDEGKESKINRIYDGVEAEVRKSQASF